MRISQLVGVPVTIAVLSLVSTPHATATGPLQITSASCYQSQPSTGVYGAYPIQCDYTYSGASGTVYATVSTSPGTYSHFVKTANYIGFTTYCWENGSAVTTLTLRDATGATATDSNRVATCYDMS